MSPENTDRMEGHDHAHILLKFIDQIKEWNLAQTGGAGDVMKNVRQGSQSTSLLSSMCGLVAREGCCGGTLPLMDAG